MARTAGRSADETRQLILTSAARLIGRHGTTVPVTDIAEAAGVSARTFHNYFTSAADALDTRVTVQMGAKKGKIVVEFGDSDDFERITDLLKLPRD